MAQTAAEAAVVALEVWEVSAPTAQAEMVGILLSKVPRKVIL
tara:strand:+ start:478 stop:603 length:126 start_codon:yes stop_codon:yes gene_type:complete